MSSVDERVVEMRFDNAQFEHGVQQTISSLDKLKQGLKFDNVLNGAHTLQNAFNNIKLSKINDNVASLNKKFSAAGVAGMEVVKRVTNAALTSAKKVATAVPDQIKNGGWSRAMNLANAKFQLEGLGESWTNVGKDVSFAVNQTSYGLDEAARVAGQLAASGVKASEKIKLTNDNVDDFAKKMDGVTDRMHAAQNAIKAGDLDQMSVALRGISGVASMTGASFSEIGQIFTRVAGQGRVYATDLNSIAVRGLNATAILAKQLGKSEADIREMTKKGEIDFNTFSNAMYNAFANQATKANDTFTGSLANMKAALSRIGADVADDVLPAGTKVFNSLRLMFNQVHKTVQPVLDSLGKLVTASGNTISGVIDQITGKMGKGGKAFTTPIQVIAKAIDGLTAGVEALGEKAGVKRTISDVKALADAMKAVNEKYNTLKNIGQGFKNIGKVIGNALDAVKESFLWTFRDWGSDLSKINVKSLSKQFADFTGTFANSAFRMERLRQIIGNLVNGILEFAKPVVNTVKTLGKAISETFNDIWGNGSGFASLTKTFRDFSKSLNLTKDGTEGLKDVFKAILSPLRVIVPAATAATKVILNFFAAVNRLAGKGLDALGKSGALKKAGDSLTQFGNKVKDVINKIKAWGTKNNVFDKFAAGCAKAFVTVVEAIVKFIDKLAEAGKAVADWASKHKVFETFGEGVSKAFTKARDGIKKFFDSAKDSGALSGIGNAFKTLGSTIVDFFSKLSKTEGFQTLIDSLGKLRDAIGTRLGDVFGKIADGMGKLSGVKVNAPAIDKVVAFFDKLSGLAGKGIGKFADFLSEKSPIQRLVDWIKELGQDIAGSKLGDIVGKIPEFFKNLFDAVKDGIQNFTFKGAFDDIKDAFKNLFSVDVYGAELNDDSDVEQVKAATQRKSGGIISAVKGMAEKIKSGIGSIDWSSIGEGIKNGAGKVIDGINSVFANPAVKLLADNIRSFITAIMAIRALKKVGDMFDSFAGVGDSIAGFFGTLTKKLSGDLPKKSKLKDFAECIALLVGSLSAISIVNHFVGIKPADIGILAGIVAGLVGVAEILGHTKLDTKNLQAFAGFARSLGIGVAAITGSLALLANMDTDKYVEGLARFEDILGDLVLAFAVLEIANSIAKTKINGSAFIGLAVGLTLLMIPLNLLASMDAKKYETGISRFVDVLAALSLMIGAMNLISNGNSVKFGTLAGMAVAMLAAVKALTDMMNAFDQLDPKGKDRTKIYEDLYAAAGAIAGIFIAFGGALKLAGSNKGSTGTAIAMIFDILAVMTALNTLSGTVKEDGMKPIITAAATMGGVFLALGYALKLAGQNASGASSTKTALAMVADIMAVFIALQTLSETASTDAGFKGLVTSAVALGGVLLALGKSIQVASKQKIDTSNIIAMVAAVASVGLALNGLAQYDFASLAGSAIALGGCLIALGGAMKMMNGVKINPSAIIGMAVAVGMLAPALVALSNIKFTALIGSAAGLFAAMAAIAGGMKLIGMAAPAASGALAALAQLAGGITLVGASIMAAAAMITAGVSMITNAIGAIVGIFSKGIGKKIKGAADEMNQGIVDSFSGIGKGVKGLGKGIGDGVGEMVDGVANGISKGGKKIKGAKDNMYSTIGEGQNGEELTTMIFGGDYTAVGNDIDTGTGVISKSVDKGGEKLKGSKEKWGTSIGGIFDFKDIDSKLSDLKLGKSIDLSKVVDNLVPDSGLSGAQEKAKGKLDKVFSNLNSDDINNAMNKAMSGGGFDVSKLVDNIPGIDQVGGDMKKKLTDNMKSSFEGFDMSQLTSMMGGKFDINKLGETIGFGDSAGQINLGKQVTGNVMNGAKQGIQEGQEGLTTGMSQNLSSLIEQQQASTEQAKQLGSQASQGYVEGFNSNLEAASGNSSLLGSTMISGLQSVGEQFSNEGRNSGMQYVNGLKEGISSASGVANLLGSTAISSLIGVGEQFANEGRNAGMQYSNGLQEGVSNAGGVATTMGATVVSALIGVSSQIANQGQIAGQQFGTGLQSGISNAAAVVTSTVSSIVSTVSGMGGSFQAAGSACGMLFRAGLQSGLSGIGGVVAAAVSAASAALTALGSRFSAAGRLAGTQYVAGLRAGAAQAGAAARQLVTNASNGLMTGATRFRVAGTQSANQYVSGLRASAGQARSAGTQMAQQAISGINSAAGQAQSAGQKVGQQFVSGLSASAGAARSAGASVANAGTSGMNAGANQAYSYGVHLGQNFAKGITSSVGAVRAAAAQLAAAAKANIGHTAPKEGPLKGGEVPYGLHAGQNFAKGLEKATPNVQIASMRMAQVTKNALNGVIGSTLKSGKIGTQKGLDDILKTLNAGSGRIAKSTVDINKMVNDAWAKQQKSNKSSKSKKSDSSSSDTDSNETFVSNLSSDIEKAKNRNQLSLQDEIKGYQLAAAKVKKSAGATKDAQNDANKAIYDSAEKYIDKRKKQFGDYATDESIFWMAISQTMTKGSESYDNAVDKMNDALVSDGEHMIDLRKKYLGEYKSYATEVWLAQIQLGQKMGATAATQEKMMFNLQDAIFSDTEDAINREKQIMGESLENTASYYQQAYDLLLRLQKQGLATEASLEKARFKLAEAKYSDAENEASRDEKQNDIYRLPRRAVDLAGMVETEGTKEYYKFLDKYQDDILKDGENAVSKIEHRTKGFAYTTSQVWTDLLKEGERDGRTTTATMMKLGDKAVSALKSDGDRAVKNYQKQFGKKAPTYQIRKDMVDQAKALNEQYGHQVISLQAISELEESAGEAYVDDMQNLLDNYRIWRDITPDTFFEDEKVANVEYWEAIVASTKEGTEENLQAQAKYYEAAEALQEEYNSKVTSTANSIMSAFNLTSETTFSDSASSADILRRAENADAAASRYEEAVDRIMSKGVLSQKTLDYLWNNIGIKDFKTMETISNMSTEELQKLNDAYEHTADHAVETGKMMWQHLILGLDPALKENGAQLKQGLENMFTVASQAFFSDGNLKLLKDGINKLAAGSIGDKTVQSKFTKETTTLGSNLSTGLANGIMSGNSIVSQAMATIVKNAIAAAKKAGNIHSPSKKTMKLGEYMGQGLVIGLQNWMSQAGVAGDQLTNGALGGLSNSIAQIVDAMGQDMSMAPVITPVLDLSQIEDGFDRYTALLDAAQNGGDSSLLDLEDRANDVYQRASALKTNNNIHEQYHDMVNAAEIQNIYSKMQEHFDALIAAQNKNAEKNPTTTTNVGGVRINIYPRANQDANDIADSVIDRINNEITRKGKVYSA